MNWNERRKNKYQEQKLKDQVLLSTYRNEKEIMAARERMVSQLRAEIIEANVSAENSERKKRTAKNEIEKLKEKKARVPLDLARSVDEADQTAISERKRADKIEVDLAEQKVKFDAALKRFRELNAEEEEKVRALAGKKR